MVLPRPSLLSGGEVKEFRVDPWLDARPGPRPSATKALAWGQPDRPALRVTGSEAGGHLKLVGPAPNRLRFGGMCGFSHFFTEGLELARQVSSWPDWNQSPMFAATISGQGRRPLACNPPRLSYQEIHCYHVVRPITRVRFQAVNDG